MGLLWGVYVGVPIVTVLIDLGLVYWIYTRHWDIRGSRWFVASLVTTSGWMVAEVAHLLLAGSGNGIVAKAVATKFAVWTFVAHFVFYSRYSRSDFHRHWLARIGVGAILVVTAVPTWVEPARPIFYGDVVVATEPFRYVAIQPGIGYVAVGVAIATLIGYALVAFVRYMVATPRRSGLQLGLVIAGSLSIMAAVVLGNLGRFPLAGKTHAEFGALPAALLLSVALFRFRLFEVEPVARNALVEDLTDPVLVLDLDHRIVDYNHASEAVWPAVSDGLGDPIEVVCPEVAGELALGDRPVAEESARLSFVVDGSRRTYSHTVSAVRDDRGDCVLYALLFREITDLERSRWLLERQNDRLEQVAATISHDLRNPISVAEGYASLLDEELTAEANGFEDPEVAREHLQRVRDAHERMTEIIDDVLALAREGQAVEETETVSLSRVARDAWAHVTTDEATLQVAGNYRLDADCTKLQTLLENLFRNSIDHAGDGVTVTVGPLSKGFFVADDGPGIDDADAESVFEYGFSTTETGTGLGLSIVQTIAESHGWTVDLDTDADGARFHFYTVEPDPAPADVRRPALRGIR